MEFQPLVDWMQFPLDIEEEEVTCLPATHLDYQAASTSIELDPPTWKRLRLKVSNPSSIVAQCKNV